jgi:type VI secretion system protein ImpH
MAKTTGPTDYPVINDLFSDPRRFTFYQTVRLIERYTRGTRVGHQGPPRSEPLRFRPPATLGFPTSEVNEVLETKNPWGPPETRYVVVSAFLGLYGPSSPLPAAYSEYIIRPEDIGDYEDRERLQSFLDIFHHRIFSLFYRVLSKYRYHLLFEPGGLDAFSRYMFSLIGRGTKGMPENRPIPAIKMVRYAGLLTQQPRSCDGLRGLIADYFEGVRVRVQQCIGRWLTIDETNRLGDRNCNLGADMIMGSRVHDRTGKFRIILGPVGLKQFTELLPNGKRITELKELVRLYLLDELDFDVEIWLRGDEVPPTQLGSQDQPALLGWTSWAVQGPGPDRSVIFSIRN